MGPDAPASAERMCRFAALLGQSEVCPREACVFWEPGGAVLEGRCAFERLDLSARPELAALLLDLRRALESAQTLEEKREVRGRLYRLLNGETGG